MLYDVPLFPLGTVLFPGGLLPLRIFETRYMDMAKICLKNETPFAVCLIASGRETGQPAIPHEIGTLARIMDWDMPQLGVLNVSCRGEQRFRILTHRFETSGLQRADIEFMDLGASQPLASHQQFLGDLLARVIDHLDEGKPLQPHRLDDADWVGYRLAELLPITPASRQQLLEMSDAADRLDLIHDILEDKGLLKA